MPSDVSTARKPPAGKGKKILGMPRGAAIAGAVALGGGVLYILWKNHGSSSGTAADTGTTTDSAAAPMAAGPQGGAMQGATGTETLIIKIRQWQGHKRRPAPPPPRPPARRRRLRTSRSHLPTPPVRR